MKRLNVLLGAGLLPALIFSGGSLFKERMIERMIEKEIKKEAFKKQ